MRSLLCSWIGIIGILMIAQPLRASDGPKIDLTLRSFVCENDEFQKVQRSETWDPRKTALIVCDVWDYHHCLNAVRRMNEFLPRLEQVIQECRQRGAVVIHAPSDCMKAYQDHPSRMRVAEIPSPSILPSHIASWCSAIPAEETVVYPIDQSDGGEDDDPEEHAAWARRLQSLGRNPKMPWLKQTDQISIDSQKDYISDRGEEVWAILRHHGIRNVILVGVHTNMCVLGRPFGLRQMARNGMNVVLMRDMTDTMYNPKNWPYVSHFEGTRRVITHIEKYVCPTISSDQILGGEEFRFQGDQSQAETELKPHDPGRDWSPIHWSEVMANGAKEVPTWYRCTVFIPENWAINDLYLRLEANEFDGVWVNGKALTKVPVLSRASSTDGGFVYPLTEDMIEQGDVNLIVLRTRSKRISRAPELVAGSESLKLDRRWQYSYGETEENESMPLPAKFGAEASILHAPEEPLWQPRAWTKPGEFTEGIEGPACDASGNLYVVNYLRQGTIGRVKSGGITELFLVLPEGSVGNGIRFSNDGSFFVADYTRHNILRVDPSTRTVTVHAHDASMHQPNDLAMHPDRKTLYASDPNWTDGTGQLWRIDAGGQVSRVAHSMGTTNGIEISPDGKNLYVNESVQRKVWAFRITESGELVEKRLVSEFPDYGFDGMRCDVDGNLYITRYGKGTVVKMTPEGEILQEIPVLGARPSNLCFGGNDRRTLFVTEVDSQRVVAIRVDRPGRE